MIVDIITPFQEWKQNLLAEIDALPDTTAKGNAFVQKVLQTSYNLSDDDAIDATSCAGAGDHGVDAVYIFPPTEDAIPRALVMQGKYGAAGIGLQVYQEANKFIRALQDAINEKFVTDAVNKVANVLKNQGEVRYVIATVEPLSTTQQNDLENIKKIVNTSFCDRLIVEATSLDTIHDLLSPGKEKQIQVSLPCKAVQIEDSGAFLAMARLTDMYSMLYNYKRQNGNTLDSIYDHNIRKYIKRSSSSVNKEIYKTLANNPSRFVAYNNGITIICNAVQETNTGLHLLNPHIVNGCQTTRTLYEFMDQRFAGIDPLNDPNNAMAVYKDAFMVVKVLVVKNDIGTDPYAKDITRYSNKQNVIRGKDFIALEDMYRELKEQLRDKGYFLQTQKGEYESLSRSQKVKYPKDTHVIDSFEATLFYAAGVLGEPQNAFGRSGDFSPDGAEFAKFVNKLTADSLFVPWKVAQYAQLLGYTKGKPTPNQAAEHRTQTRHLFQYLFFRLIRQMIATYIAKKKAPDVTEGELYALLKPLMHDYDSHQQPAHPFYQILSLTDQAVATFMKLAETQPWYTDRNAFLKGQDLMDESHFIMAMAPVTLNLGAIANQVQQITSKAGS